MQRKSLQNVTPSISLLTDLLFRYLFYYAKYAFNFTCTQIQIILTSTVVFIVFPSEMHLCIVQWSREGNWIVITHDISAAVAHQALAHYSGFVSRTTLCGLVPQLYLYTQPNKMLPPHTHCNKRCFHAPWFSGLAVPVHPAQQDATHTHPL